MRAPARRVPYTRPDSSTAARSRFAISAVSAPGAIRQRHDPVARPGMFIRASDPDIIFLAEAFTRAAMMRQRLRDDLLARFRAERIEPSGSSRVERILGAGRALFERRFTGGIVERLPAGAIARLEGVRPR